jgi:hypothetical protein
MGTRIYHQLHWIICAGIGFHSLKKGVLDPATPIQITERASSVPPGIYFHFHVYSISDKKAFDNRLLSSVPAGRYYFLRYNRHMGILDTVREKLKSVPGFLSGRKFWKTLQITPRMLFGGAGALFVVLLACLFAILWNINLKSKAEAASAEALARSFEAKNIPPEELFWPDEPDFVPHVQLDRLPQGLSGETGGVSAYWTDPEESGRWEEHVRSAVDSIMEKVP